MIYFRKSKNKKKARKRHEIQVQNIQLNGIIYLLKNLEKDLDYIQGLEAKEMIDSENKDKSKISGDLEEIEKACGPIKSIQKHQKKQIKKQRTQSFGKKKYLERKNK